MTRLLVLIMGAMATVIFALVVLVILPKSMLSQLQAPPQLKPPSEQELAGRSLYISNGCIYCHTQQVRDPSFTADISKGLGSRPSVPEDYIHDKPHLLGTMRTGPDLFNVGARLPDRNWHLLHLYQPRALVPWSIMPAFPFLFRHKPKADPGDKVLEVPKPFAPGNGVVVVSEEAEALVDYLISLRHDYPAPSNEDQKEVQP
ncbi:cbb3-type cytochrome c oxidase subunit II [Methylobacillus arboreus]|uniref:cbb3-type cytochrome c oxidase subunit II n=1 Tax=Methylobacillus arboreus TaxID=755170 RepID=UPI001E4DB126|nr:cbb3-type cytochrome c oxidase subunit II [Methylobacillus arboreus]MCB5191472.1 cbb3-type cytochrome c oxidase subunit II [Methylobacillus arboreus]